MTVDELYAAIENYKPSVVYLTGKTSTGKSTFARKLATEFDYAVINLDDIVVQSVIKPRDIAEQRSDVFLEVYKLRNKLDWIKDFVDAAHDSVGQHTQAGSPVIIDGAIAHIETMQELLRPYPNAFIAYFHPTDLELYTSYLTERFMGASIDDHNGLPKAFWDLVDKSDFITFCNNRVLIPSLRTSIKNYAQASQASSLQRLVSLRKNFPNILIIDI
jgi:adenylate kinase family enzyme